MLTNVKPYNRFKAYYLSWWFRRQVKGPLFVTSRHYKWEVITYDFDFSCEYSSTAPLIQWTVDPCKKDVMVFAVPSLPDLAFEDSHFHRRSERRHKLAHHRQDTARGAHLFFSFLPLFFLTIRSASSCSDVRVPSIDAPQPRQHAVKHA